MILFLQNYRLKLGGRPVLYGVGVEIALSAIVAGVTFTPIAGSRTRRC